MHIYRWSWEDTYAVGGKSDEIPVPCSDIEIQPELILLIICAHTPKTCPKSSYGNYKPQRVSDIVRVVRKPNKKWKISAIKWSKSENVIEDGVVEIHPVHVVQYYWLEDALVGDFAQNQQILTDHIIENSSIWKENIADINSFFKLFNTFGSALKCILQLQ